MVLVMLIIVTVVVVSYVLMSTEQVNHINRPAVAMFSGVVAWLVYMMRGGTFLMKQHQQDYTEFLNGKLSQPAEVKNFVANHIMSGYVGEACQVILFMIATITVIEIMNNNGVFSALTRWLRTKNAKTFLWSISLLTFVVSANIDNLTTVILMLTIMNEIVKSHSQKLVFASAILVAANLGGSMTVIGDITSLMLWTKGVVTPTAFFTGLVLPALAALVTFNVLAGYLLKGNMELNSVIDRYRGDDTTISPAAKTFLLFVGIVGLWAIPTFHYETKFPPFLGAMCLLALVWVIDGLMNIDRYRMDMYVQRSYYNNTEFTGMRLLLYYIGITLGVGALKECGAISAMSQWMTHNVGNVYVYGGIMGLLSSVIDNVPLMMIGLNAFDVDTVNNASEFAVNGTYWQLLSLCSAMGGSLFMIGSLAGHQVMKMENIRIKWLFRHYVWRVLVAWLVAMLVFWLTH